MPSEVLTTLNDPDLIAQHPEKRLLYSSPLILGRRRRLMSEARHMIAEDGLEGFSIRRLCQRAKVAQRTLYNAFQSKDRLIALAIRDGFEDVSASLREGSNPASLSAMIARTIAINRRNFAAKNYTKAVCAIYFAPTTPNDIWCTLREMSLQGNNEWLQLHQDHFQPWVDHDHFLQSMANMQYATINDWCLGRLSDDKYLPRLAENKLLLIIGAVRGELAAEAIGYLEEIRRTGQVPSFARKLAVQEAAPAPAIRRRSAGPRKQSQSHDDSFKVRGR